MAASSTYDIPFGGNAYITHRRNSDAPEVITDNGLANWMDSDSICSLMFHVHLPRGAAAEPAAPATTREITFDFDLRLYVADKGSSIIRVALKQEAGWCVGGPQEFFRLITGSQAHVVPVGQFRIQLLSGMGQHHVQIDLQGVENTNGFFADVSHGIVSNLRLNGDVNPCLKLSYVAPDFSFHFGRRGPSVHLNYVLPRNTGAVEYFYNEIFVPPGQDVLGSYFCAIGFQGGYFGIQVNSSTERRILFSIWSAFETDCPDSIPDEYKVRLMRKSPEVHVQAFGCEGSGQQSFLRYNWHAGQKYKFLVRGTATGADTTQFTAWFRAADDVAWRLIASFHKPRVAPRTYLSSIYSFAENFEPDMGHVTRKVYFGNQWTRGVGQEAWVPVTQAKFTGDDTSKVCRKDYAGGTENGAFFLQHCGFLCERVDTGQMFCCAADATINREQPGVILEQLP